MKPFTELVEGFLSDLHRKRQGMIDDACLQVMALTDLEHWKDLEMIEPPASDLVRVESGPDQITVSVALPAFACRWSP